MNKRRKVNVEPQAQPDGPAFAAIMAADPPNALYAHVDDLDLVDSPHNVGETMFVKFDAAHVAWYQQQFAMLVPSAMNTQAVAASWRNLDLEAPLARYQQFNHEMLQQNNPPLRCGTWWLLEPGVHFLRGSMQLTEYRHAAASTDPCSVAGPAQRTGVFHVFPRMIVPRQTFALFLYALSAIV